MSRKWDSIAKQEFEAMDRQGRQDWAELYQKTKEA